MINPEDMPRRFRIEDPYHDDGQPTLVEWYVVRKTPAGAWVAPRWAVYRNPVMSAQGSYAWQHLTRDELKERCCRYVLDGDGKRFAHETVEWARYSYKRRKQMQISHAHRAIERAKNGLHWLETGRSMQDEVLRFEMEAYHPPFEATGVNGIV